MTAPTVREADRYFHRPWTGGMTERAGLELHENGLGDWCPHYRGWTFTFAGMWWAAGRLVRRTALARSHASSIPAA